jgi:hypothetical protein
VTRGRNVASPQVIVPTSGGGGYASAPAISFASGSGSTDTLASGTAILGAEPLEARKVRQIIVDNGGSGYTTVPNITISGGGGAGAAATASLANNVYKVSSISVTQPGAGYTADPAVTITGGGGSGATGRPILGNGANWGKIYLITALARTSGGARAMLQMEAATAITGFHTIAALTVDGPNPVMGQMPNSQNFTVSGIDANSCGQTVRPPEPAVGGYDDPNADPPTQSVQDIIDSLPDDRLDHYYGEGDTPSVRNIYESLGETLGTTTGLRALIDGVQAKKTNPDNSTVDFGTANRWAYNYIDGDLNLNGNTNGYGVLVVTGRLIMSGNFTWYGVVLVVGDGIMDYSGGGNGNVVGTVLVAKIYPDPSSHGPADLLPTLGSPTVGWNGGGTNLIQYDHCWADNVMATVPVTLPISLRPLKVLSFRSLPY